MKLLAENHPGLSNSIALDRGYIYSSYANLVSASNIGLRQNECITKNCSPFKPWTADAASSGTGKFYIQELGFSSTYYCSYKLPSGTEMVISCYRNGSGKLVHMQCAKSEWLPFTYDWEHAGVDKPPEIDQGMAVPEE